MGDRYTWIESCPVCAEEMLVAYAESCGMTTVTCCTCGTVFDIKLRFVLKIQNKQGTGVKFETTD